MTNREKHEASASSLRYLDLSFEGRRRALTAVPNNGFRPHGGHRGTKRHPPSMLTFNKPAEYHQQLQSDIDRLMEEAYISENTSPSPAWVQDVTKEPMHSPESPLFQKQLLAAKKSGQQVGGHTKKVLHRPSYSAPTSRAASANVKYRPNQTHQYLGTTELKQSTLDEVDCKFGRPTRTTLLRARQRCNSAPVNSYHARREAQKKAEQKSEVQKNMIANIALTVKDVLQMRNTDNNSVHSFLIGARYNRAHYVDAKSVHEFGVYTSRSNPQNSFVLRNKSPEPADQIPHAPAVTPQSAGSAGSTPNQSPTPSPTPTPQNGQAWASADQPAMEVSIDPVDMSSTGGGDKDTSSAPSHVINLNDGLNIKGMGYQGRRPRSGKVAHHHPSQAQAQRPMAHSSGLFSVYIQGTAIGRSASAAPSTAQLRPTREGVGNMSTLVKSPSRRRGPLTVRDIHHKLNMEKMYRERNRSSMEEDLREPLNVSVVDRAMNVPSTIDTESIAGNVGDTMTGLADPIVSEDVDMASSSPPPVLHKVPSDCRIQEDCHSNHSSNMDDDPPPPVPIIRSRAQSAKTRGSRVRFADQSPTSSDLPGNGLSNHASDIEDSVTFFMTEDSDESPSGKLCGEDKKVHAEKVLTQPSVFINPFNSHKASQGNGPDVTKSVHCCECDRDDELRLSDTSTHSHNPQYSVGGKNGLSDETSGGGDSMIVEKGSADIFESESSEEQAPPIQVIGVDIQRRPRFGTGSGYGDR